MFMFANVFYCDRGNKLWTSENELKASLIYWRQLQKHTEDQIICQAAESYHCHR